LNKIAASSAIRYCHPLDCKRCELLGEVHSFPIINIDLLVVDGALSMRTLGTRAQMKKG
jgi:hypothetical protein